MGPRLLPLSKQEEKRLDQEIPTVLGMTVNISLNHRSAFRAVQDADHLLFGKSFSFICALMVERKHISNFDWSEKCREGQLMGTPRFIVPRFVPGFVPPGRFLVRPPGQINRLKKNKKRVTACYCNPRFIWCRRGDSSFLLQLTLRNHELKPNLSAPVIWFLSPICPTSVKKIMRINLAQNVSFEKEPITKFD